MAFDPTVIADIQVTADGPQVHLSWSSTSGGPFQVYSGAILAWAGDATRCTIPRPPTGTFFHVGAVASDEVDDDFSGSLAAPTDDRAILNWSGGTYLAADLAGFHVYGSAVAGGAIVYTAILATIAAYPAGLAADGYGLGGYGDGGYGEAAGAYSWTSGRLTAGTWQFEVRPFDSAGNERTGNPTASVTIAGPPNPPARDAAGNRLEYTLNPTTRVPTLTWQASP